MKKLKILLLIIVLTVSGLSGCATVDLQPQDPQPQKDAWYYYHKGVAYAEKGEHDAAIEQFKMAIKVYPNDPADNYDFTGPLYLLLAISYHAKGQYEDAVSYYQKVIARGDGSTHIFRRLAKCYNELNQYNDAITAGIRATELDFSNDSAHFALAWAFFKTKQHKNAVKAYKKAIELAPDNSTYYNKWGVLLYDSEDYAGAVEQFKKAVSLKPDNSTYLSNLFEAYYMQGKYNDALDVVDKTILLMSFVGIGAGLDIVENYTVVTTVFDPSPAKKAGIKAGDKIIKVDGKTIKGWKLNDIISDIKGQEGTSVVLSIERKDTKNPLEIAVIRENIVQKEASLQFGRRSLTLRYIGKKQESIKDAKQAYSLDSSDLWAQLALGAAYLDKGRYDEAIKLLSQVASTSASILEATAHAKKGDFKKTINIYASISEEELSQKDVPIWSDRTALLESLSPFIYSKIETAGRLKAQGRYKEALKELGEAMKVADDKTSEEICGAIYRIMSLDPRLSVLPEEARKYVLRGDVLTEEGKFEEAVKEYRQAVQAAPYIAKLYFNIAMVYGELQSYPRAVRHMKTYLNLAPEAPNARAAKDQIYKWEFKMEKGT